MPWLSWLDCIPILGDGHPLTGTNHCQIFTPRIGDTVLGKPIAAERVEKMVVKHHVVVSINGGTTSYHPFLDGFFPNKNHPAIGVAPWPWKPSCENPQ